MKKKSQNDIDVVDMMTKIQEQLAVLDQKLSKSGGVTKRDRLEKKFEDGTFSNASFSRTHSDKQKLMALTSKYGFEFALPKP